MSSARGTQGLRRGPARGFTLIEVVIAIVVMGVGLAGVLLALDTATRASGDPVVERQMSAIAQTLMEEIAMKPFSEPLTGAPPMGCGRTAHDEVDDYNNYTASGACSVDGTPITALAAYKVQVWVAPVTFQGIANARKITVRVSTQGMNFDLIGWRTDYAAP